MAILLTLRKQEFQLDGTTIQVKAALQKLNLSPEAHLLVRDGELLNENDYLKDGDTVKIVAVISGGCLALQNQNELAVIANQASVDNVGAGSPRPTIAGHNPLP